MIKNAQKRKFLQALEKHGNVSIACKIAGIKSRATYYRWIEEDPEFKKNAEHLFMMGIENNCDITELSLMKKVKEGDMGAIKYQLSHNSPRYKPEPKHGSLTEEELKIKERELYDEVTEQWRTISEIYSNIGKSDKEMEEKYPELKDSTVLNDDIEDATSRDSSLDSDVLS